MYGLKKIYADEAVSIWRPTAADDDLLLPDSQFAAAATAGAGITELQRRHPAPEGTVRVWSSGAGLESTVFVAARPTVTGLSSYRDWTDDSVARFVDLVRTAGPVFLHPPTRRWPGWVSPSNSAGAVAAAIRREAWYLRSGVIVFRGPEAGWWQVRYDPKAAAARNKGAATRAATAKVRAEAAHAAEKVREAEARKVRAARDRVTAAYQQLAVAGARLWYALPVADLLEPDQVKYRFGENGVDGDRLTSFRLLVTLHERFHPRRAWRDSPHVVRACEAMLKVLTGIDTAADPYRHFRTHDNHARTKQGQAAREAAEWFWRAAAGVVRRAAQKRKQLLQPGSTPG